MRKLDGDACPLCDVINQHEYDVSVGQEALDPSESVVCDASLP